MLGRIRDVAMLVFAIVLLFLLMIYNRTRVYWRADRRFNWVPDHIPAVDAIVTASEWVVLGIFVVAMGGLLIGKLRGLAGR